MRTSFKVIAILLLLGLVSGAVVWSNMDSEPTVVIDQDELDKALSTGAGSMDIEIEGKPDWHPNSLGEVRSLLGEESLLSAHAKLTGHLEAKPESGATHVLMAEVLRRLDRLDEALVHSEKGAQMLSNKGRAHYVHARVLASRLANMAKKGGKMGLFKAAGKVGPYRDALRTAIELDPDNVEARKEEVLFYLVTPMIGDPAKGLQLALAMESEHPMQGKLTVARALYFTDKKDEAVELAREAVGLFPDSTEPTWILGSILNHCERYDEAEVELAKLTKGPKDETYYQAIYSRMLLRTRQDKDGETVLILAEEYLAANPQWEWAPKLADVLCEKAYALHDLGRLDEARATLQECLQLDPDSDRAKRCLKELKNS